MKTLNIAFAVLLFVIPIVEGQDYIPFPTQNASWNVYLESSCDNESPPDTFLLRYTVLGDTTIKDKAYNKLIVECGDTINPTLMQSGGIREEGKKIYYFGPGILGSETDEEFLLYDFNVQIEDTINHSSNGSWKSIVLEIDSIKIGSQYRKRYKVDNGWQYHNPDYIIEGIGSVVNGLLGHVSDIPTCGYHYWEHVCFHENGQVIHQNPSYTDCYAGVNLSSLEVIAEKKIRVYPNPFTERIQINNPLGEKFSSIKIFSSTGQLILEEAIIDNNMQILVPGPAGIYIAIFKDSYGKVISEEKIIKE